MLMPQQGKALGNLTSLALLWAEVLGKISFVHHFPPNLSCDFVALKTPMESSVTGLGFALYLHL